MYHLELYDVEVKDGIYVDLEIEFVCCSPGYAATWDEPGEGPEFEITGWEITGAWSDGWNKSGAALNAGGWMDVLAKAVDPILDDIPDLYDCQYDAYLYHHNY